MTASMNEKLLAADVIDSGVVSNPPLSGQGLLFGQEQ